MNETLSKLGELLLSSIPTIFFLLIVWFAYRMIVHKRLEQVLAERHRLTEGAVQQAQAEIASAEARTAEYERRLREARTQIYKAQDARRQQAMERRNAALTQARQQAEIQYRLGELEFSKRDWRPLVSYQANLLRLGHGGLIETGAGRRFPPYS